MKIAKIVSGGQTGADRGGLDAAIYFGLPYGGYVPKGRKAEDGTIPERYKNLREIESSDYLVRTEENIIHSDITFIFCHGEPTGGSLATVRLARRNKRLYITIDLDKPFKENFDKITKNLHHFDDQLVINVAGSRESKHRGIQKEVADIMTAVIAIENKMGSAV
jgi:hypothetical protein